MRRRFRRKRSGIWLPVVGSEYTVNPNSLGYTTVGSQSDFIQFFVDPLDCGPAGPRSVFSIPLVVDNPNPELGAAVVSDYPKYITQQLSEEESFGYFLRRVVGNIYVCPGRSLAQTATGTPAGVIIGAGLMVRRIDPENPAQPVLGQADTDPLAIENIQDPWMWRRTWVLTPPLQDSATTGFPLSDDLIGNAAGTPFNGANTTQTGMYNNCSVDVKSRRKVAREERLFLDVTARALGFGASTTQRPYDFSVGAYRPSLLRHAAEAADEST